MWESFPMENLTMARNTESLNVVVSFDDKPAIYRQMMIVGAALGKTKSSIAGEMISLGCNAWLAENVSKIADIVPGLEVKK
jgi:hypothetical protein